MASMAEDKCMAAPYPLDLIIPLRFRPCAKDGTPLMGPMIATGGQLAWRWGHAWLAPPSVAPCCMVCVCVCVL